MVKIASIPRYIKPVTDLDLEVMVTFINADVANDKAEQAITEALDHGLKPTKRAIFAEAVNVLSSIGVYHNPLRLWRVVDSYYAQMWVNYKTSEQKARDS
jgi:hypothetical protein